MNNDEEDLTNWLNSQAQMPTADAAPTAADPWSRMKGLMSKQAGMQYTTPERFTKPVEAEKLKPKDEWRSVMAMLLNVVGDKGRGLADIQAQDSAQRNYEIDQWRKSNSPQALAARELQMAQLRNTDRQGFEQDRAALGDQISQERQTVQAQLGQQNADRLYGRQLERDIAGDVQHQMDAEVAQSNADRTFNAGRDDHKDSVALQRAQMAQAAAQAAAAREQSDRHHVEDMDTRLSEQATRNAQLHAEREAELEKAGIAAGVKKTELERLQRNDLVSQSSGYSNDAKEALGMLPQLTTVDRILKEYEGKSDIPGLGSFDSTIEPGSYKERALRLKYGQKFIDDTLAMRNAINRLSTVDIKNISGAHVPDVERAALLLQSGAGKMDERAARAAIDMMRKGTKAELRGRAANREQAARDVLRGYGAENYLDPDPPPTPTLESKYSGIRKKVR